jgi:outer membrane protein assembly factor BamA
MMRSLRALLLVVCAFAASSGCRPAPPDMPGRSDLRVDEVRFKGVAAFDADEIREVLATKADVYNPFVPPSFYSPYDVATDVRRIETFYHARGYFDARVSDYQVDEAPDDEQATVEFTVVEGEPSFVDRVVYDRRMLGQVDARELLAGLPIREGQVFREADMQRAAQLMRTRMQENAYAHARVEARAFANRDSRTVSVYYFWDRGPACVFGEVVVEGNRRVPADLIVGTMPAKTGEVYRQSLLRESQFQLYNLNAFNLVEVEAELPNLGDSVSLLRAVDEGTRAERPEHLVAAVTAAPQTEVRVAASPDLSRLRALDPRVRLVVKVVESPGANYRVGGGAGVESGRSETYLKGSALWLGVVNPLNRVEAETRVGYAWLANGFSLLGESLGWTEPTGDDIAAQSGVVGTAKLGFVSPRLIAEHYDLTSSVRYEEGLEPGYRFRSPSAQVGVARAFSRRLKADVGYGVDIFFIPEDALDAAAAGSLTLPNQFSLAAVSFGVTEDRRDDPLQTRSGLFAQLQGKLGESVVLGDSSYVRLEPEVRYFAPLHRRLVVAGRARTGLLWNVGTTEVPRTESFYLGGGDTVRGFPQGRLSPNDYTEPDAVARQTGVSLSRDAGCLRRDEASRCTPVPVGGWTSWLLNLELRGEIGRNWLYGTAFIDGGGVGRDSVSYAFDAADEGTQWAVGTGLRIATPIGPVRFDVGWRLTDPAAYATLDRLNFYLAIGEAF